MPRYQLRIAARRGHDPHVMNFESEDSAAALHVLGRLDVGSRAELWQEDKFVCNLSQDAGGSGVWSVKGR